MKEYIDFKEEKIRRNSLKLIGLMQLKEPNVEAAIKKYNLPSSLLAS